MEFDSAVDPWAVPEHATRQLPKVQRPRRPWWVYVGITLVLVLWIAGVALVALFVVVLISLGRGGNNK